MDIDINLLGKRWGIDYTLEEFVKPDTILVEDLADTLDAGSKDESIIECYKWVVENINYPWREVPDYLGFLMLFADLHILFRHPVRPKLSISPFEHWKFPEETLHELTGDCEDSSILLCSLLRNYTTKAWVVIGYVDVDGILAGHAWVEYDGYLFESTLDMLPSDPWIPVDEYYNKVYYPEIKFNDMESVKVVNNPVYNMLNKGRKRIKVIKKLKKLLS